ncbi:MAG: hypothetical protein WAT25_01630 [Paracoccaceae bacterium]
MDLPLALAVLAALAAPAFRMPCGMRARNCVAGTVDMSKDDSFAPVPPTFAVSLLTTFIANQMAFPGLGRALVKRHGYSARIVIGPSSSAGSCGLICPGVGLSVMLQVRIKKRRWPALVC